MKLTEKFAVSLNKYMIMHISFYDLQQYPKQLTRKTENKVNNFPYHVKLD